MSLASSLAPSRLAGRRRCDSIEPVGAKPLERAVHPERAVVAAADRANSAATGFRGTVIATAAGLLVLLASLANYLGHHDYPLFRPEIGLAVLLLAVIAAALGGIYAAVSPIGRTLLQLLLVLVALDINFGTDIAIVATVVVGLVLRRRMMPFMAVAASVVLVLKIVGIGLGAPARTYESAAGTVAGGSGPPLVHIIVDEHAGVEGLLGDAPEVAAMREKLVAFYGGHGFRLFGGAYSHYFHSTNSIPEILNFGDLEPAVEKEVAVNAWFDRLGDMGYRINVSQTDFLRYCENAHVVSCDTRRAFGANYLDAAPIAAVDKVALLLNELVGLSRILKAGVRVYNIGGNIGRLAGLDVLPYYAPEDHMMPAAIGALQAIDELTATLANAESGNAYFLHALAPHSPFFFTADCQVKPLAEWHRRDGTYRDREAREVGYFAQISCLTARLETLLRSLDLSAAGRNAIVLIHGDHGSRITDVDPQVEKEGRFRDEDVVRGHSALFAVRAPGIEPGYEPRRAPVAGLLAVLADSGLTGVDVPSVSSHEVVLEDILSNPVRPYPLPAWWTDPQ